MEVPEDSTIEDFERFDVVHLKDYLAKRGVSQKGKKAELVALAYSCNVMNRPLVDTYTLDIQQAFNDYEAILTLPTGIKIPDPFKVQDGWIGEEADGMKLWPPICTEQIVEHLKEPHVAPSKLPKYKNEKGYDYFKTGWLKEIYCYPFEDLNSDYPGVEHFCLLKAKCTASQRLHDTPHDVWLVAEKETGKVACAYCNCAAG